MSGLPTIVAFKFADEISGKYLRLEPEPRGYVTFTGDEVLSPFAKFELQRVPNTKFFNIRSCYNNKYWKVGPENDWIVSGADQPVNDPNKDDSTLFELVVEREEPKTITIKLHRSGKVYNVWPYHPDDTIKNIMAYLDSGSDYEYKHYEIINVKNLTALPRYVAFKGDNEKYLQIHAIHGFNHLQFSASSNKDKASQFEVFTNPDGSVRIKSIQTQKFWEISSPQDGWVGAMVKDENSTRSYEGSWFVPESYGSQKAEITLRNVRNNKYCWRYWRPGSKEGDFLCANTSEMRTITVEELVTAREIYEIRFRPSEAIIRSRALERLEGSSVANCSLDPMTKVIRLTDKVERTTNWNSTVSLKIGVSTKISIGMPIKLPVTVEYNLSAEAESSYQWGESKRVEQTVSRDYTVTIRPGEEVNVVMTATRLVCDIPFTYSQRDTLMDGEIKVYEDMEDGMYSKIDYFNVQVHVESVNVPCPASKG